MQKLQLFTSATGQTLQPALGQACDQCRRRKARCNRAHPCVHCTKTDQVCSYDEAPKTRGRRPKRKPSETGSVPSEVETPPTLSWTGALPDLTNYALPAHGIMDEQQLPLTPTSGFNWQTPCVSSTLPVALELVKTPAHQENAWSASIDDSPQLLGRETFLPFVHLFFERLYAVFPVIEKRPLLGVLESPHLRTHPLPTSLYTFLTALSAAVIVQLNISQDEASMTPDCFTGVVTSQTCPALSADLFVAQCLETRRSGGFIEDADEWTVLTSFFLFAYYGNCDQPRSAWYYLREAIGFAQSLGLDDPDMYLVLDTETSQRRRLLFWLLFVTERAYALQHRSRVVLQRSIGLPHVFESSEPKLMYGFVTLARVFATVDNAFITAWRSQNAPMLAYVPGDASQTLSKLLREDVEVDALEAGEMDETQRLDILVTQQWLKTLAWQLQSSLDPSSRTKALELGQTSPAIARDSACVVEASKNLLDIVHTATSPALEAHGIGMEQKVSDVANCLCDVLEAPEEPEIVLEFFSTQDFLHQFMVFLADFRRRESQYLQPLLQRASRSLSSCIQPQRPLLLEREDDDAWLIDGGLQSRLDHAY